MKQVFAFGFGLAVALERSKPRIAFIRGRGVRVWLPFAITYATLRPRWRCPYVQVSIHVWGLCVSLSWKSRRAISRECA